MPGGAVPPAGTTDVDRVEAPITWKAYLMCTMGAFGGMLFGYDSGYISGVLAMDFFINMLTGKPIPGPNASQAELDDFVVPTGHKTLIVSILSAGTFFGAIIAGDFADWIGRRLTVILGCFIYGIGCVMQTATTSLGLLVAGRLVSVSLVCLFLMQCQAP